MTNLCTEVIYLPLPTELSSKVRSAYELLMGSFVAVVLHRLKSGRSMRVVTFTALPAGYLGSP